MNDGDPSRPEIWARPQPPVAPQRPLRPLRSAVHGAPLTRPAVPVAVVPPPPDARSRLEDRIAVQRVGRPLQRPQSGVPPEARRRQQQDHIRAWKRRAALLATAAFGGFWALAFGHPVGTAAQQPAGTTQPVTDQGAGGVPANQNTNPNPFFGGGFSGGLGNGAGSGPVINSRSS